MEEEIEEEDQEVNLEHGMFAMERIEDIVAIVIAVITVIIALILY